VAAQVPNLQMPLPAQPIYPPLSAGQQNVQTLPNVQVYQPVAPDALPTPPQSRLEGLYNRRASRPMQQFGYDVLGVPTPISTAQFGAVQDDYVLGPGDEVVVELRGQQNASYRGTVDRNGQVVLPGMAPIQAGGRTFGQFREELDRQTAQTYISTNAFVSLGQVRQIAVFVTGEVRSPGTRIVSGLSTPLDAILLSGGVAKTGSLRNVTLIRGNQSRVIDLYAILTQGNAPGLGTLQNGDRIFVPPLGNTVGVAGTVRRQGIYELRSGTASIDANALIALAGGYEIAGTYRLSKIRLEPDGTTRLIPLPPDGQIVNGEILFVDPAIDVSLESIELRGAVRLAGLRPRDTAPSVGRLIRNYTDLDQTAYTPFALISRRDPRLNTRVLIPFSLARVLAGANDVPLQGDDTVYIFSRNEMRALADAAARSVSPVGPQAAQVSTQLNGAANGRLAQPGVVVGAGGGIGGIASPGLQPLGTAGQAAAAGQTVVLSGANVPGVVVGQAPAEEQDTGLQNPITTAGGQVDIVNIPGLSRQFRQSVLGTADNLGIPVDRLMRVAGDNLVWVLDEVHEPGAYLAAAAPTLADMITIAGGPLDQADLSYVEVTSTSVDVLAGTSNTTRTGYKGNLPDFVRVSLRPLDVVRLRPVFSQRDSGQISINGQVRFPGNFDITRAERLSSVLERAGGLTDEAYPYGAIFTRQRAATAEHDANLRAAREIESQIASPASTLGFGESEEAAANRAQLLAGFAQNLRDAPTLGRIAVTADLSLLRLHPELDILLEPGDKLYIPKRPSTVTVSGEVLNTGSFQYETGLSIHDYLERAGGTTQTADASRAFVLLPDGSARTVGDDWLTFNNNAMIPPGSTVIVPRDVQPFNLNQFLKDATQIVSQIAISAASLAVISHY
jgi:protein involved in polysaccharide export with SLBB domain